ncbi:hypothetical protein [Chitinibacter sp. S2-10]|uniref:hypothetical protein n=1 Tax=Chitinibacter sp. S2-10 TaxID=3373597 RepID=UPI003977D9B4
MSRNPYHVDGVEPTLRKSAFVFMDILGYSDMLRHSDSEGAQQETLRRVYKALEDGRTWLEDGHVDVEWREMLPKDRYALKAFTDNIVIGWPVRDDAEAELGSAFSKLAHFQFDMVTAGFFIRGAISVGDAYVDEIAVFGGALSEAYIGESTKARDPRIILTESAATAVKQHLTYYGNPSHAPQTRNILRDSDGQLFLNYLDCLLIAEDEHGPFYDQLEKHKVVIEVELKKHKANPVIWSKYAWVAGYHNYFCDLYPQYFSEEHKIQVDLFRASPSLIIDFEPMQWYGDE